MKYIKQEAVCIKPVKFFGNDYYQIGVDDWNIVVGLGGLVEITNQANKIIKEYMDKLDEEVLTMAEYIEREALMVALCKEIVGDGDYYNGKDDMQDQIRDMVSRFPAADVTPVRHGRWLHRKNGVAYCSECEIDTVEDETEYCPNCGAKMDLED